jgi:site-specific DNA-cytosine methylase
LKKILKSTNFGVLQKRRRLFLVGVRKDIGIERGIDSNQAILSLYPKGSSFETSFYDVLQGLELNEKEVNLCKRKSKTSTAYEILKLIPTNPSENYEQTRIIQNLKPIFQY